MSRPAHFDTAKFTALRGLPALKEAQNKLPGRSKGEFHELLI